MFIHLLFLGLEIFKNVYHIIQYENLIIEKNWRLYNIRMYSRENVLHCVLEMFSISYPAFPKQNAILIAREQITQTSIYFISASLYKTPQKSSKINSFFPDKALRQYRQNA